MNTVEDKRSHSINSKLVISLLVWTLGLNAALGQDSLDAVFSNEMVDPSTLQLQVDKLYALKASDPERAFQVIQQAEIDSRTMDRPQLRAQIVWEMALLLSENGQDSLALEKLAYSRSIYIDYQDILKIAQVSVARAKIFDEQADYRQTALELESAYETMDSLARPESAGYVHNFLGLTLWKLGRLAEAERHLLDALRRFTALGQPRRMARVYNNLGVIYFNWNRYEEALSYYQQAASLNDSLGNSEKFALLSGNIGGAYLKLGNVDAARSTLMLALDSARALDNLKAEINASHWLGTLEFELGNFEMATQHINRSRDYYHLNKQFSGEVAMIILLGQIQIAKGKYSRGETSFLEATALAADIGDKLAEATSLQELGYTLMLQKKYREAADHLHLAEQFALDGKYREVEIKVLAYLGTLNFLQGEFMTGHALNRRADVFRDSLFNFDLRNKISELQVMFDLKNRDREIVLLNEQAKIQMLKLEQEETRRFYLIFGITGLILLLLALASAYLAKSRSQNIIESQRKDLQTLNQKLQTSIEEQNRLFRIISHDLRGPMGTMKELLNLIVQGEVDPDDSSKILQSASQSANSLYRLIENLFSWARLRTGDHEVHTGPVDLSRVIHEVQELMQGICDQKDLTLNLELKHYNRVTADVDMTASVIRNLLSNAIKFSNPGGLIDLQTQEIKKDGDWVEISVKDNGIGIPEDAQAKIFDPTESLRRKGTQKEPTSGLGLALAKEFVELQGGQIYLQSQEEDGSKFSFTLPVHRDESD